MVKKKVKTTLSKQSSSLFTTHKHLRWLLPILVLVCGGIILNSKMTNQGIYGDPSEIRPTNNHTTISDWKTYSFVRANSTVPKFQLKYPESWDYREVSAGDPLHLNFYTSSIGELSRQVNDTLKADDPKLPQPLKAPIEIQISVGEVDRCPCEDVTIGGLPAKKIMLEHWEIIELVKNDYTFSIMRSLKDGVNVDSSLSTEKEIEIFNTMLSTFKFIN